MWVRELFFSFYKSSKNLSVSSFIIFCLECVDISQVQCIKSYKAQEHDELTLEKADILHAKTITSDGERRLGWESCSPTAKWKIIWAVLSLKSCCFSPGWVEGIRLSDGERGWFPKTYIEEITSRSARLRNLRENIRIKCVTQKLKGDHWTFPLSFQCCAHILASVTHILDVNTFRNFECCANKSTAPQLKILCCSS